MSIWPSGFKKLLELLQCLPGIGKKSAQRIVFYILSDRNYGIQLSDTLKEVSEKIKFCKICGNITDKDVCDICADNSRDGKTLCVVETPADLFAIESAGVFRGKYHILGGVISPLDGVSPDDLRIQELIDRVRRENINEIIIATNPTTEGEATAMYIARLLKPSRIKITRIAQGLSIGSGIDIADGLTLLRALEGRRKIE